MNLPHQFRSQIQEFHKEYTGYCASLNHYSSMRHQRHTTRLSPHTDASLISVFPFGIEEGLQIETYNKQWLSIEASETAVAFTGYLCQLMTENQVKATNHRVIASNTTSTSRYSYVFFSLPKRNIQIPIINSSSQSYFEDYLKLF